MNSYGGISSSGRILILTLRVLCWNKFLRINFHSYIRGTKQGTKKGTFHSLSDQGGGAFLCKSDLKRLRDALNMYKLMFSISPFTFALVCTLFVALLSGRSKLKVE